MFKSWGQFLFQINAHSHLSNFLTPCETARTLSKTVNTASNWLHREFLGSFISSSHHQPQMQWHVNTQSYCKVTHMLGIFEPGTETISSMTCARNSWQSAVWFHQVSSLTGRGMNPPFWFFSPPENMSQKLACCTSLTFKTPVKKKKNSRCILRFFHVQQVGRQLETSFERGSQPANADTAVQTKSGHASQICKIIYLI